MLSPASLTRSRLMDDAGEAEVVLTRFLLDIRGAAGQLAEIDPNGTLRRHADDLQALLDAIVETLKGPRPSMPGALAPSP